MAELESAVESLLRAVGEDPTRSGLVDTPSRVARMWTEVLSGYSEDPRDHLATTFEIDHSEIVAVTKIPFASTCEHHMLPFVGEAHIAYLPGAEGRFAGLSKLARVVDGYARRLQVQERLTSEIADAIAETLVAEAVLVVMEAEHTCMSLRGVRKPGTLTVTSSARGSYSRSVVERDGAMRLLFRN